MTLAPPVREFLGTGRKYASIATIDPDGAPRQALIWYTLDGDEIVINSLVGRRWPTNLLRDPRISILIGEADGSHWVGITGIATPVTDQATAQADIAAMSDRYDAAEPEHAAERVDRFRSQERISFRIRAVSVYDHID
jgi:PPOX class probable F420-dependent enzyme